MDWFDLTHWQAILAAIVAIGTPIVAMLVVAILGWPLLRWFGSLFKRKGQLEPDNSSPSSLLCRLSSPTLPLRLPNPITVKGANQ